MADPDSDTSSPEERVETSRLKRSKKSKSTTAAAVDTELIKKKKRKAEHSTDSPLQKKEKSKRRKKDPIDTLPADEPLAKKKRETKNETGFPNPSKDESLSDQAQKSLAYAYTQFRHPSKWKFQKAKQNWLVRNVWSSKQVPDNHVPLVAKYVSQMHGVSRTNLSTKCKEILSSDTPPETNEPPEPAFEPASESASATTAVASVPTSAETPTEAQKARAQILLSALTT